MAFKPAENTNFTERDPINIPAPRAGLRKGRVSLIVDLGTQAREDFEDPKTKEVRKQNPCKQVLVYVDLVNDVVDYGGNIGKKQYRLPLYKDFKGEIQGINFSKVPPRDADGNMIEGKPWGFHPANVLTKIAKAINKPELIVDGDIEQFLGEPLMVTVEVKKTEDKNGKMDKDGNLIVYTNVGFKALAPIPEDDDGNPVTVADLEAEPRCLTFDNATEEDIRVLRPSVIKKIKQALDYEGSQMQAAIEAFEASKGGKESEGEKSAKAKPADKAKAKEAAKKAESTTGFDEDDSDAPF